MAQVAAGGGAAKSAGSTPPHQPAFDPRITSVVIPGQQGGSLFRGYMVQENVIPGRSHRSVFRFLFNPTTVEAVYNLPDTSLSATLMFPNPLDNANVLIPVNQSVSWSLLFDRTYELWGAYGSTGQNKQPNFSDKNNPAVNGVWADVFQLQEFTGMNSNFTNGTGAAAAGVAGTGANGSPTTLSGHQGIMMMIPSWVFFGGPNSLHYYGFISEWDVTFTHWTQFMIPMRAAVDITFTLLPPPAQQANLSWVSANGGWTTSPGVASATGTTASTPAAANTRHKFGR